MTTPDTDTDAWLCAEDASLAEAIRRDRANGPDPDACPRGGNPDCGCSNCAGGRSVDPHDDDYVPEYVRTSVKKWRPAS
jgi:hypothetical protein